MFLVPQVLVKFEISHLQNFRPI